MTTRASVAQTGSMADDQRVKMVVLQPTSRCNLDCTYCYIKDRTDSTVMDDTTLTAALTTVFESSMVHDGVELLWHAGEPLVAGIDFYKRPSA